MSSLVADVIEEEVGYIVDRLNTIVKNRRVLAGIYGEQYYLNILKENINRGELLLHQIDLEILRDKYQTTIRTQ